MQKETLDTISAVATVATPMLLVLLGGLGWLIQQKITSNQAKQDSQQVRIRELEDKLREDRIATYNSILEPFFLMFTSEAAFALDKKYKGQKKDEIAIARMLSVEYRQLGFKLSLVAGDEVVRAYNTLMQFFYHTESDPRPVEEKTAHWISLMGTLLLEIRKSMGNTTSNLDRWEMIEWFMSEAPELRTRFEAVCT
ncbi:hypothetical protein [Xanthomonas rydalmerensis]|uniref:DUF4760 domain-containing protein n=1 Tax=Xanthomonas rydalmerensis TaxID=3046274 RepID=A0ABZ0JN74_9XANT|nr:hypothetical protein [Xanthomonas sp. DM-2023]WOS41261.1 hypothetical protein QN243_01895 [Xanthomonas sp. DM-2023]WOS45446.1 hypothetical protein QN242_01895 [Xanthomonas sp. DM-2023]WOS49625.1 hypothetical protein QN240_01895 [Xanthomonas sp. DM-2023]WOS53805.1 hypothetical protein QN244_01895 [Xanthomonas sp. DM-2023]WOS57988.1 hypothetical protein QN245_01895 [Xanthomonas sp. DM-2023]